MPFTGNIYSLSDIKQLSFTLMHQLNQKNIQDQTGQFITLAQLDEALTQFFDISEKIEIHPELLESSKANFSNVSELGDYGLQLLAELEQWVETAELADKIELQLATLSLGVWIHDHQGKLEYLESIVNALSQLANKTNEPSVLAKLHKYAEKITNSVHEAIKADKDKSEPGRPWRILNLNHGIIATRTHNTDIMNRVFEQLLHRLPEDAPLFFAEGMKQMDIIGYPQHVRHVMEQFYQLTSKPTLH